MEKSQKAAGPVVNTCRTPKLTGWERHYHNHDIFSNWYTTARYLVNGQTQRLFHSINKILEEITDYYLVDPLNKNIPQDHTRTHIQTKWRTHQKPNFQKRYGIDRGTVLNTNAFSNMSWHQLRYICVLYRLRESKESNIQK